MRTDQRVPNVVRPKIGLRVNIEELKMLKFSLEVFHFMPYHTTSCFFFFLSLSILKLNVSRQNARDSGVTHT